MPKRVITTRTLNPLPFESLEPHRFEDLVRRLLYGFREWIDIEPTGRGGSDDGFDIRAWEKSDAVTNIGDEGEEGERSTNGNLWQVQGKREKSITPAKIKKILQNDIDPANPPYGYILAAATNISKTAYDIFRKELRKNGVKEFFFWGKDYLEDQLSLPANDEVLFTFFGISLSPRRRSRTSEIKFSINNKNKILKVLFGGEPLSGHDGAVPRHKTLLMRDIKDQSFPFKDEYPDFDAKPRWQEHDAVQVSSRGVYLRHREWYAYCDFENKIWDYTTAVDLTPRRHNLGRPNELRTEEEGRRIEHYWRHLAYPIQAKLKVFGFVAFEDILIIDDKGDPEYPYPHVFVDFSDKGPFSYMMANLSLSSQHEPIYGNELEASYQRTKTFPETFPDRTIGRTYDPNDLAIVGQNLRTLTSLRGFGKLYGVGGQLGQLKENELIRIPQDQSSSLDYYAEVTHCFTTTYSDYQAKQGEWEANRVKELAGRDLKAKDAVVIYEIIRVFQVGDHFAYSDSDLLIRRSC